MIYGNTAPPRKVTVLGNQVHTSRVIFGAAIGDQIRECLECFEVQIQEHRVAYRGESPWVDIPAARESSPLSLLWLDIM
jgi:hypothetical protein